MITKVSAKQDVSSYWKEVWQFRELLFILSWRDIKVRYKQTLIGAAWALIRPLLTMLIFTFVFGKVAGFAENSTTPYPIIVLVGVLAWQLISSAISQSSGSLLGNERLITKVYFPRILIPASTIATSLLDFVIALFILFLLMLFYGQPPNWSILFLPVWLLLTLFFALGVGLGLAALNVRYRDFRYALPFAIQLGLYISPVGFSTKSIPEQWQLLYEMNPVVGIIESFRWMIIGGNDAVFPFQAVSISLGASLIFFYLGFRYFKQTERTFADII